MINDDNTFATCIAYRIFRWELGSAMQDIILIFNWIKKKKRNIIFCTHHFYFHIVEANFNIPELDRYFHLRTGTYSRFKYIPSLVSDSYLQVFTNSWLVHEACTLRIVHSNRYISTAVCTTWINWKMATEWRKKLTKYVNISNELQLNCQFEHNSKCGRFRLLLL